MTKKTKKDDAATERGAVAHPDFADFISSLVTDYDLMVAFDEDPNAVLDKAEASGMDLTPDERAYLKLPWFRDAVKYLIGYTPGLVIPPRP